MEGQNTQTQTLTRSTVKIALIWAAGIAVAMAIGILVMPSYLEVSVANVPQSASAYVRGSINNEILPLVFKNNLDHGVRITELTLTVVGTNVQDTDLSNISLFDKGSDGALTIIASGSLVGGKVTFGKNTVGTFDTTGLFDINAKTVRQIMVMADVPTNATAGHRVGLKLNFDQDIKADDLIEQKDLSPAKIRRDGLASRGRVYSILASGSLRVLSESKASVSLPKGTVGQELLKFSLSSQYENIAVSAITIKGYQDPNLNLPVSPGVFVNLKLSINGSQIGNTCVSVDSNGVCTFTFDNGGILLYKGLLNNQFVDSSKKIIVLYGDISATAVTGPVRFGISAQTIASDIVSTGLSSGAAIKAAGRVIGSLITIQGPALTVSVAPDSPAASYTANTTDATVLRLNLVASTAEDIKVSSIKFYGSDSPTLQKSGVVGGATTTNLKLFDELKNQIGNTSAWTIGTGANGDYVTFSGLNIIVPKNGQKRIIDLKLAVFSATGTYYFGVKQSSDIVAIGVSSGSAASVSGTAVSPAIKFINGGSLMVSDAADTPKSTIVAVGGPGQTSDEVTIRKIKFTAVNEATALTQINLYRALGDNYGSNYQSVSLYNGNDLIGKSPAIGIDGTEFTFYLSAMSKEQIVPKNGDLTLTVKAVFSGVGDGTTSGAYTALGLLSADSVKARGVDSNTYIVPTIVSGNLSATDKTKGVVLMKSKPILYTVAVSGAVGGLTNGTKPLYKFSVAADNKGDISWKKVNFNISGLLAGKSISNGSVNNFKIFDVNSGSFITGAFAVSASSGGLQVSFQADKEQKVEAGRSNSYELRGDVVGALGSAGNNSIVTNIPSVFASLETRDYFSIGATSASFIWSDRSASDHSETTKDWANDYLLGLPTQLVTWSL